MRTAQWWTGIGAAVLPAVLLLVWGCPAGLRVYDIGSSHRAALRAVHGAHVNRTMKAVNASYRKAHRLPIRQMLDRAFGRLEHCAEQIAASAARLPEVAELNGLSPEEQVIFARLASQLKVNAEALKSAAVRKSRAEVREAFARLTSTCNACHAAFREETHAGFDGESR